VTFVGATAERIDAPIYDGTTVLRGDRIAGPAVIEYPHTSIVVPAGAGTEVDDFGSVVIELGGRP
jgi:N-methylhydantoinase A